MDPTQAPQQFQQPQEQTRGQRLSSLNTVAGGRAAPGFFERIREREKLEDEARSYLRSEANARRMLRGAYRRAVQSGEYDPQLLYAYNDVKNKRSEIDGKYKQGMESPEEATANYLKDYYDAEKLNPTGKRPEAFDSRLLEMYRDNTNLDPNAMSEAWKEAMKQAEKDLEESIGGKPKIGDAVEEE